MDKHCIKCNDKLVLGDNWTEYKKKTYTYICRLCNNTYMRKKNNDPIKRAKAQELTRNWAQENKEYRNTYAKEYIHSLKDGEHKVYLLPECNYVGVTNNPIRRFIEHKSVGRDNTNPRILYSTPDREEAEELEALLHDMGYEGKA